MEYLLPHGETLKSFNEQNPETRLVRDAEIESVAYSAGKTELATWAMVNRTSNESVGTRGLQNRRTGCFCKTKRPVLRLNETASPCVNSLLAHILEPLRVRSIGGIMGFLNVIQGAVPQLACFRVIFLVVDVIVRSLDNFHSPQQPTAMLFHVNGRVII